jgi:hypothetical protein
LVSLCLVITACGEQNVRQSTTSGDAASSTDSSDGADAGDASDTPGTDATDGVDAADGADTADGSDAADGASATDGVDAADGSDATDAGDGGDVTDASACPETSPPGTTCIVLNVDMSCSELPWFEQVFVTGPWNGWCGNCVPLSDPDGDMVYTTVLEEQPLGSTLEYKYAVDNWADQEYLVDDMLEEASCAPITDLDEYANRTLLIEPGAATNDTYGSCEPCEGSDGVDSEDGASGVDGADSLAGLDEVDGLDGVVVADAYDTADGTDCTEEIPPPDFPVFGVPSLQFQVDMGPGFNGSVTVGNDWHGWGNAGSVDFEDYDGDGIFIGTMKVPAGTVLEYRFILGTNSGGNWENIPSSCGVVNGNYINRVITMPEIFTTLEVAPFGGCPGDASNCDTVDSGDVSGPLLINEVLYDPANYNLKGDANGDGEYGQSEDEFIEIVNVSNAEIDVSGYTIQDTESLDAGVFRHIIPAGTVIPAGKALVVFGGGTPTGSFGGSTVQKASSGSLDLGHYFEKITLANTQGVPVASFDIEPLANNPNQSFTREPDLTGTDFVPHSDLGVMQFSPGTNNDGTPFGYKPGDGQCFDNDLGASQIGLGITSCDDALSKLQGFMNSGCKSNLAVVNGALSGITLSDICECACPTPIEEPPYCVTLTMKDSGGDGWNGGYITIDMIQYTMDSGSETTHEVCYVQQDDGCTSILYTAGSKSSENSWTVKDIAGNIIGSGGANSGKVGNNCGLSDCANCQSLGPNRMYCGKGNYGGFFNGCATMFNGSAECNDGRDEIGGTHTCTPYIYFPPEG